MATSCPVSLAWESPWTEESGGLYSPWGGLREGAGVLRQGGESSVNLTPLCLVQEVMGHFTGRVKEENGAVL